MSGHDSQWVYVIQHELGPVKIGIAEDPHRRLGELQVSCPFELTVRNSRRPVDAQEVESFLHDHFERYHMRGEWFDIPPDLRDFTIPTKIHSTGRPNVAVPRGGERHLTAEWGELLERVYRSMISMKAATGQINALRAKWKEYGAKYLNDESSEEDQSVSAPDGVTDTVDDVPTGRVQCTRCGHYYDRQRESCPKCRGGARFDPEGGGRR